MCSRLTEPVLCGGVFAVPPCCVESLFDVVFAGQCGISSCGWKLIFSLKRELLTRSNRQAEYGFTYGCKVGVCVEGRSIPGVLFEENVIDSFCFLPNIF